MMIILHHIIIIKKIKYELDDVTKHKLKLAHALFCTFLYALALTRVLMQLVKRIIDNTKVSAADFFSFFSSHRPKIHTISMQKKLRHIWSER
jgi:hypothetical protein